MKGHIIQSYVMTRRKAYHPEVTLPWSTWKTLNRLRTETGRTSTMGNKIGGKCECGGELRDAGHLFACPLDTTTE